MKMEIKAADGAEAETAAAESDLDEEDEWKTDVQKERDGEKEVQQELLHARAHMETHRIVLVRSETIFSHESSVGNFIINDDNGDEAKCRQRRPAAKSARSCLPARLSRGEKSDDGHRQTKWRRFRR